MFPPAYAYFSWRFEGLEHIPRHGPALIACNHASYLDPLANVLAVVRAGRRPRFLAKEELFHGVAPRLGSCRVSGRSPCAEGPAIAPRSCCAEQALAAGEVVAIYPEGTVTSRGDGLPMEGKTGAVRLALASGVPIIPMASWGSAPVWQKSGPGSFRPRRPVWVQGRTADRPVGSHRGWIEDFARGPRGSRGS